MTIWKYKRVDAANEVEEEKYFFDENKALEYAEGQCGKKLEGPDHNGRYFLYTIDCEHFVEGVEVEGNILDSDMGDAFRELINAAAMVNNIQHSGQAVYPEAWSRLYNAVNHARAFIPAE